MSGKRGVIWKNQYMFEVTDGNLFYRVIVVPGSIRERIMKSSTKDF